MILSKSHLLCLCPRQSLPVPACTATLTCSVPLLALSRPLCPSVLSLPSASPVQCYAPRSSLSPVPHLLCPSVLSPQRLTCYAPLPSFPSASPVMPLFPLSLQRLPALPGAAGVGLAVTRLLSRLKGVGVVVADMAWIGHCEAQVCVILLTRRVCRQL